MQIFVDCVDCRDFSPEVKHVLEEILNLKKFEKYEEAIEKCKILLNTLPESPEIHTTLGDLFYEKHINVYQTSYTIDDAINQYQFALEMRTNSPILHYKLAKALTIKGDFDKALVHLKTCIKLDPNFHKAYFLTGSIESKRDNIDEAIHYIKQAITLNPIKSSKAYFHLALITNQKASKSKSIKNYIRKILFVFYILLSIILLPFDNDSINNLKKSAITIYKLFPIFIKGYYYENIGSIEKAISLYTDTLEYTVGFTPLYISLGDCFRKINRMEDAINEYRMAIWLNPCSIQAYKNLCSIFEEIGDYDNAIHIYKKLISFKPNDAVLYSNMANILYMKGDVTSAISAYQTAIILNPNKTWTSVVSQTLGYVYQETKGDYDAAISAYQSALLLNPKDVDIYISLGSAFFDKGDLNNALAAYRSALQIDPNNAKVHCNMGYLLWGKSYIEKSIAAYEKAIRLDPYYDIAYNNLGVIYLDDLGNLEKAVNLFHKAVEINPNYALAYYNIGRAMCIKGDKIEAARLFQIAIDLNHYTNELDPNEIKDRIARLFDSD